MSARQTWLFYAEGPLLNTYCFYYIRPLEKAFILIKTPCRSTATLSCACTTRQCQRLLRGGSSRGSKYFCLSSRGRALSSYSTIHSSKQRSVSLQNDLRPRAKESCPASELHAMAISETPFSNCKMWRPKYWSKRFSRYLGTLLHKHKNVRRKIKY